MPRGDGTGPPRNAMGRGGRMQGSRPGAGPSGYCVCPSCGERAVHKRGVPCYEMSCPKCGKKMVRE
ncbi:MAG: hypothetical protein JW967_05610 [Dehalococcoidales bacterium]|nr:hypothetical protein [Dehalococcoidales bacterium]